MYTSDDVVAWKKEYGDIHEVQARGKNYVFRPLTYAEHDKCVAIERAEGTAEAEDAVVEIALLYPSTDSMEFDRIPAGIITSLADSILASSAMGDIPTMRKVLEEARASRETFRDMMKAFVCATMPYKEEDLDQLTFKKFASKLALAEMIIEVQQAAFGGKPDERMRLELIDPAEEAERERQEAIKHATQKKPGEAGFNDPIAQRLHQALR